MDDRAWTTARSLVMQYGWNATCYQILNSGMQLWFSQDMDAVVGYSTFHRVRVVAGAPVCRLDRLEAVARELEADTHRRGERLLFFGAGTRLERLYSTRSDHHLVYLGAQPTWDPRAWSAIVEHKASLRAQLHRARNKGVQIREWPATRTCNSVQLRSVLRTWLSTRGLPPLGFMVTPNLLDHVEDRRVFVAERGKEVVAFLIASPIPARGGWLVEQWPRVPHAPNGTTHLLVDAAMRAFADAGSTFATLGLAPLSQHHDDDQGDHPAWLRFVLHWIRSHGRRFYNFRGLDAFKSSLQPMAWEPIFAIAQGDHFTPRMLRAIAGVFAEGSPEWLVMRAVGHAIGQESRTLWRYLVTASSSMRPAQSDRASA